MSNQKKLTWFTQRITLYISPNKGLIRVSMHYVHCYKLSMHWLSVVITLWESARPWSTKADIIRDAASGCSSSSCEILCCEPPSRGCSV